MTSPWTRDTEFWVLNPGHRILRCFEHGQNRFVFTQKTYAFKRNMAISPRKLLDFHSRGRRWQAMLVEYHAQVTLLYTSESGWKDPVSVWPSWSSKLDSRDDLIRMCRDYPQEGDVVGKFWGDEREYRFQGGEKRIIIRNPPGPDHLWTEMFSFLTRIKRQYPDIIFHMHGGKSVSRSIGASVDSFDHPVTLEWRDGIPLILLPNGQTCRRSDSEYDHWGKLIGERLSVWRSLDPETQREEIADFTYNFNLKSLLWAQSNRDRLFSPRSDDLPELRLGVPDTKWHHVDLTYRPRSRNLGDKWLCDTCTIAYRCPYSRAGAVCIVDGTEASQLAKKFRNRNSSDIIDGLSTLLGAQAERFTQALSAEQEQAAMSGTYKLSPAVSSLANHIFDKGVQMARLLDPNVAAQMAGSRINVGIVNANAAALSQATPQQLMAGVVAKLEQHGISIEDATEEQVEAVLRGETPPMKAIEGRVIDHDAE